MIRTDRWQSEPPCVYPPAEAGHMAKRRVGIGYSPSMLESVRPGAVSPDRALCLPTSSHFLIVNKTSLTHTLSSLSFSLRRTRKLWSDTETVQKIDSELETTKKIDSRV